MGRVLTLKDVDAAVKGGSVFACGGGGWVEHGLELGRLAVTIGRPELVSLDEVPDDAWIATAAAIGAPGGLTDWQMLGVDYVKAVQLVQQELGAPIHGLIVGQNGMSSTLNGWLPSAILGTKVIDAVGDLRAHPTGDMGSLGLASSTEPMIQAAVGGNRQNNAYIELVVKGATAKVSPILRKASDMSGGFIASCRNPIPASYVRQHAALGGISQALGLGEAIIAAGGKGGSAVIDAICSYTGGHILGSGKVTANTLRYTDEAFDVGVVDIGQGSGMCRVHVMNEHMAVDDAHGQRLATYPDVITTLDMQGNPISAGQLKPGMEVVIFHIHHRQIALSSSVVDPAVYPSVEKTLGIELFSYLDQGARP
ncbi:DUF917 domain-containing protein [Pseudomonas gingeri]|uniref:DUF917 domain-containing protein n=1 Tax=Pseudomonas gingeri TaxID=117681 RepID=A0A7Y8CNM2_9PSED|nr:DUF917 domain-containing protein [Pseudomonas gingeri]NWB31921.1 DUF917 domain-containing protein [Pseudomonas gingeri]NWC37476.1 DUF917 domain-containing protein [Pseudomonas gingeri]NWD05553.1 DUF917 domain-containing protein [Pseudomonas gingeri]NWE35805.1 DUF917 domain-containing protein [Pseudomonas gingeri]NWE57986.1 DUF917 domain-containing protein [Pseudomonas gingeri]